MWIVLSVKNNGLLRLYDATEKNGIEIYIFSKNQYTTGGFVDLKGWCSPMKYIFHLTH
jgi:hypothetical protein